MFSTYNLTAMIKWPTLVVVKRHHDSVTKIISESSSPDSRSICECDRKLVNFLAGSAGEHNNYGAELCVKAQSTDVRAKCCLFDNFMYQSYNPDKFCCGANGVKKIGFC